jgi:hypothetical protein
VHEHWDTSFDIFSSDRYSGPNENGIDYISVGYEGSSPNIRISIPKINHLYIAGREIISLPITLIIGKINVEAEVNGISTDVEKVEFYIDDNLMNTVFNEPYTWLWNKPAFFTHSIKVIAYYDITEYIESEITVWKFF